MRVLAVRQSRALHKPLKGFADVLLDNGVTIRDFRIVQEPGERVRVFYPMVVLKSKGTGEIFFKSIIECPDDMKGAIDLQILIAWEKEQANGNPNNQPK